MCTTLAAFILLMLSNPNIENKEVIRGEFSNQLVMQFLHQELKNSTLAIFNQAEADTYLVAVFSNDCLLGRGEIKKTLWEAIRGRGA